MKKRVYSKYDAGKAFLYSLFLPEILVLCFALLALVFASSQNLSYDQLIEKYWFLAITVLLSPLAFFITFLVINKKSNINWKAATGISFKLNTKNVLLCILISVVCLIGLNFFVDLFDHLISKTGFVGSYDLPFPLDSFGWLVFYIVFVALLPAVFEEIIFRGIIFNGLKEYGIKTAIFGSAALFMLTHGGIEQSIYPLVLGIILALVYHNTGNIIYSIIVHFCNNALVIIINFVMQKCNVILNLEYTWWIVLAIIFAAIISVYIIVTFIVKALKKQDVVIETKELNELLNNAQNNKGQVVEMTNELPNVALWVGVICGILFWILDLLSGFGIL